MKSATDIIKKIEAGGRAAPEPEAMPQWVPFYDVKYSERGEGEIRQIKINFARLVEVLRSMGFRRLDLAKQSFIVRITDNVVEEVHTKDVIDSFVSYLGQHGANLPDGVMVEALLSKLYGALGTYFSENILYRLTHDTEIRFNEHAQSAAYFYYRNGYVEVTADGVQLLPYHTLKHHIWKNQILDRDFVPKQEQEFKVHPWAIFCANIANAWQEHPLTKAKQNPDTRRLEAFRTLMGYCLHSYYEGKLKAVIFTDARISEEAAGRSGKTLLCKALGRLLNAEKHSSTYVEINGKDFDTHDRFKYQELTIDTRLVHINDVARGFNFEDLFNDITEGIRAQRKNEAPFPVQAKMILSTNRTIRIHGDSAKDRCLEFEFADYYGADWSPEREFGQWFFRDWSKDDWACFDNYMLHSVALYLRNGVQKAGAINLTLRKMVEETAPEFIRWMEERQFVNGQEYNKAELHHQFITENPDFSKLKQKTFTKWARIFGDSHPTMEGYEERRSSGKDLIKFNRKPEKVPW